MLKSEYVKDAIKDIKLRMEFVLLLISLIQMIKDAKLGIMEYAPNAQQDGIQARIMYAIQFMIYVEPGLKPLELVNHAIMDILFKMENVLKIPL